MAEILVCGGDLRQVGVANALIRKGHKVYTFLVSPASLLNEGAIICTNLNSFTGKTAVLPLPCSFDDIHLNCSEEKPPQMEELLNYLTKCDVVYGGKLTPYIKGIAYRNDINIIDYLENEVFSIKNAKLTAEGAVEVAMQNTKTALLGTKAVVIGYGRIGKLLADLLSRIGLKVTVCARSYNALAWAEVMGYNAEHISKINSVISSSKLIFNTVPSHILDFEEIRDSSLYIELASKPYGADVEKELAFSNISSEIIASWVFFTIIQSQGGKYIRFFTL